MCFKQLREFSLGIKKKLVSLEISRNYICPKQKTCQVNIEPNASYGSELMFSLPAVIYLCKGEDDTVIERKGSEEEPFEFTTQEGKKLLLFMIMIMHI